VNEPAVTRQRIRAAIPDALRLVLFDLDDTLCDYAGARASRLRRAFSGGDDPTAHDHLALDLDRLVEASIAMHPHGVDHFPRLLAAFGVGDPAVAERAARWYRANRFLGLELFPEALPAIEAVRSSLPGSPAIGVVTNGPADVQREKVTLLGIDRAADFVIISGEFGAEKPAPAIFDEALRLGGAAASEAIMVGDSLDHDIAGAQAVGMASVWVNRTGGAPRQSGPRPDVVIRRLEELPALLQRRGRPAGGC